MCPDTYDRKIPLETSLLAPKQWIKGPKISLEYKGCNKSFSSTHLSKNASHHWTLPTRRETIEEAKKGLIRKEVVVAVDLVHKMIDGDETV